MKPLEDLLVVDFSQFLSGPSASLRLADLGARVIKIERPGVRGPLPPTLHLEFVARGRLNPLSFDQPQQRVLRI